MARLPELSCSSVSKGWLTWHSGATRARVGRRRPRASRGIGRNLQPRLLPQGANLSASAFKCLRLGAAHCIILLPAVPLVARLSRCWPRLLESCAPALHHNKGTLQNVVRAGFSNTHSSPSPLPPTIPTERIFYFRRSRKATHWRVCASTLCARMHCHQGAPGRRPVRRI